MYLNVLCDADDVIWATKNLGLNRLLVSAPS